MSFIKLFWADKTTKYVSVEDGSDTEDRATVTTSHSSKVSISRSFYFASLSLFAVFPILIIALFVLHGRLADAQINNGFLKGFTTELDPIKSVISEQTVRFTGGLHYHKNGTLYRETIEGEPQYVGNPSPEIDAAWNQLLKGQYMNLVGDEASSMTDRTWKDDHGNYEVALDVMHTLHCVTTASTISDRPCSAMGTSPPWFSVGQMTLVEWWPIGKNLILAGTFIKSAVGLKIISDRDLHLFYHSLYATDYEWIA
ncbi:hypothetical protein BPAE_0517g00030 [Botrytis paeoniae]|uniref:Uncharacterized protein n=1 Tax=Botrytis paeoniae TaxID=278948 RepID=A0A4Z1EZC5_9HELO|nr:hypothetical protein BPAE_0517g00030 [Botrytis paeoniae]